jgi:hypothetical protein
MLKYSLAESFNHQQGFPNMRGMWGLTIAQRQLLMGKIEAKSSGKGGKKKGASKPVKRYSMDELKALDQIGQQNRFMRNSDDAS